MTVGEFLMSQVDNGKIDKNQTVYVYRNDKIAYVAKAGSMVNCNLLDCEGYLFKKCEIDNGAIVINKNCTETNRDECVCIIVYNKRNSTDTAYYRYDVVIKPCAWLDETITIPYRTDRGMLMEHFRAKMTSTNIKTHRKFDGTLIYTEYWI